MNRYAVERRASRLTLVLGLAALGAVVASAAGWVASPTVSADAEPAPRIEDFAYSMELRGEPDRVVQTATLPIDVYRNITREDFADVRVFSADGNPVPHAVRVLPDRAGSTPEPRDLSLFPLRPAKANTPIGDVTIHVEKAEDGQILDIRTGTGSTSREDGAPIRAYILHLSASDTPVKALDVTLADGPNNYALAVNVDASDNLSDWRRVAKHQTIARLQFDGQAIEHTRIPLKKTRSKYLRLTWGDQTLPADISKVRASFLPTERVQPREVIELSGVPGGESNVFLFDTGGFAQVSELRVVTREPRSLIKADIFSSSNKDGPWRKVAQQLAYRIEEKDQPVENTSTEISPTTARYWKVVVVAGGSKSPSPMLELAYQPMQLLFVSKDRGPYVLAYGNHDASPSRFTPSDILDVVPRDERNQLPAASATLGPSLERAGRVALTPPEPPPPVKKYVLWAVLVLGAGLLGILAVRLARSMR